MLINAYCTHRSPPTLSFPHTLRARRDRTDPELGKHLQGFMGFIMDRGKRPMTAMRYHVLGHLERVHHHLSLEVDAAQMDAFAAWAHEANAIVFMPDTAVRAPNGAVLVAPGTGDPEPGAEVPFPIDALRRKAATETGLGARGMLVARTLPPVVSEVEVELRSAADVAMRCLAIFACAVRAETLASQDEWPVPEIRAKLPRGFDAMTPKELAFMSTKSPDRQQVANFAWRYEALATLAWAIGVVDAHPFPETICDVPALARAVSELHKKGPEGARLRDTRELLDALDLHYRLHWLTTEARVTKAAPPQGLEPGVIMERHYALNWLTRFQDAEWDDVQTPT